MSLDDQLILEKKLTEQVYRQSVELFEQRRRMEKFLYEVSEPVAVINPDLNIIFTNKAIEQLLDKSQDELVGSFADDVIKLKKQDGSVVRVESYCRFDKPEEHPSHEGVILSSPTRDYYVNLKSSIIEDILGPKECVVTLTNITKDKELEIAQNDFISITSHELRTPLTIIRSYLWMLQNGKGGELNDKQKGYLDKASVGIERMLALINDSLDVSRIEQNKMELKIKEFPLSDLIKDISEDFELKAKEKNLNLNVSIDPPVVRVLGDESKVREIITNLLGNSFKFTDIGSINISCAPADGKMVRVSIKDTGKGISADDLPKLFKKFGRIEESYSSIPTVSGTGLGLYIVKSLVEKMNGTVGVTSQGPGTGSEFWFTLPLVTPPQM